MLNGIHFLLTYGCTYECDHCFLFSGPHAPGTFTLAQVRAALDQAAALGTVEWVFFEGGEPFLYYPVLVAAVAEARRRGFRVGIVTNAYWATAAEDADAWLAPLGALGVETLSVSEDVLHGCDAADNPAPVAREAAARAGVGADTICIEKPEAGAAAAEGEKGAPVVGGDVRFKGRAVEKLAADLPRRPAEEFTQCTREALAAPGRVHVDPFGFVHVCQGLTMGNLWETPLAELVRRYDPALHPIVGPLLRGGPVGLAREYGVPLDPAGYVDECHLCYLVRRALVDRFPAWLAPRQVYGLTPEESSDAP